MQVLHTLFQNDPESTTVTSELNGQLINVSKTEYNHKVETIVHSLASRETVVKQRSAKIILASVIILWHKNAYKRVQGCLPTSYHVSLSCLIPSSCPSLFSVF